MLTPLEQNLRRDKISHFARAAAVEAAQDLPLKIKPSLTTEITRLGEVRSKWQTLQNLVVSEKKRPSGKKQEMSSKQLSLFVSVCGPRISWEFRFAWQDKSHTEVKPFFKGKSHVIRFQADNRPSFFLARLAS